ncbi:transposase InsO family protein [Brevibacterium luteolum]|uniref:DDE-type integrase/transposase/recombinase n=1 Tax=Brevibacterium luteolum TaxID=199591 RepID=UPI00195E70D3|nr:transposase InsO family protein [Brevibacterium luteolum]
MTYPLVRDLAATGVPVAVTCRVLGFTTQGFYKWCANPVSARDWEEAHLLNAAYDIHADDPEFGYRFIADELAAGGYCTSERRVWRLCSRQGLFSHTVKRARKRGQKPGPPVCDDLVERDFTAQAVNELWLTDITEHHTGEGKLYMCAVKDVFSNRIVGYAIDSRMKSRLAVEAIDDAVARRGGPSVVAGCLVHSDRGSQLDRPGSGGGFDLTERIGTCPHRVSTLQKSVTVLCVWSTRSWPANPHWL